MFLKRDNIRMLITVADGISERDAGNRFSDSRARAMELYVNGLVSLEGGRVSLTDAGKALYDVFKDVDVDALPEVVVNSQVIEALQLWQETGNIPDEWIRFLERKGMVENGAPNKIANAVLRAYDLAEPALIITNDVVSFLSTVPPLGTYDDLVEFTDLGGYGRNVLALLQAMRLLRVSPPTSGRASYVITPAAKILLEAIGSAPSVVVSIIVGPNHARALEEGKIIDALVTAGLQTAKGITEFGKAVLRAYQKLKSMERQAAPVYLSEAEHDVLSAIKEIMSIHRQTPAINSDYNTILERLEKKGSPAAENLGGYLHSLEMKGFVDRVIENARQVYLLSEWGRQALAYGPVSVESVKAVAYAEVGKLPLPAWIEQARKERVISTGVTDKGRFYHEVSRHRPHIVYITGHDAAVVTKTPRNKYVGVDELLRDLSESLGEGADAREALVVAESKNLVDILPNGMVTLTDYGRKVKEIVESAKTREFISTAFPVTPLAYSIVVEIHNNREEIERIWKKAKENRKDFYGELAKWLANRVKAPVDDVIKTMEILRGIGILGEKSLTDAGKKLATVF